MGRPRWGSGLQPQKSRLHKHSTNLTGNRRIPITGIYFVERIGIGRWARFLRGPQPRALPVVQRDTTHGGVCQLWRTVRSEPVRVASFRMDAVLEVHRGQIKAARSEGALSGSCRRSTSGVGHTRLGRSTKNKCNLTCPPFVDTATTPPLPTSDPMPIQCSFCDKVLTRSDIKSCASCK